MSISPARAFLAVVVFVAMVFGVSFGLTQNSSAAPVCSGLAQEAEAGDLSGVIESINDGSASQGKAVTGRSGVRNAYTPNNANIAEYCVNIPAAGDYRIDMVVDAPDARNDSLFYSVDGSTPTIWHVPTTAGWETRSISAGPTTTTFTLPAGDLEFAILHRETGTRVDYFAFVAADAPAGPLPTPMPAPTAVPVGGQAPYVALTAPGTIQAEFYDVGGPGVAYSDLDPDNKGGVVRNDGVDIYAIPGTAGHAVGRTRTGEWMEYTVDFDGTRDYAIDARVSSANANPGSLAVSVDGSHWKTLGVDSTGSWWTFDTVSSPPRSIADGERLIRVVVIGGGEINIDSFEIRPAGVAPAPPTPVAPGGQSPYVAVTVPGTIEAEFYDLGGAGVAYQDLDDGNVGGQVRSDDVDVYAKAGEPGHAVGRTRSGEWLEYTVTFDGTRDYVIDARVASGSANPGSLAVSVDGVHWKTLGVDSTGSWWTWDNVISPPLTIEGGERLVRVVVIGGGQINIDSFEIREAGAAPVTPTPTPVTPTATPTPVTPTATPVPPAPDCGAVAQQAEAGEMFGNLRTFTDSRAEGTEFVGVLASVADQATLNTDHRVDFCVDVARSGTYIVEARVLSPTDTADSLWVGIDDQAPVLWNIDANRNVWVDDLVSDDADSDPARFELTAGQHLLSFYHADTGVRLDSFTLRPLAVPQTPACDGPGIQAENGDLSGAFEQVSDGSADQGSAIRAAATNFDPASSIAEFCVSVPASSFYTLDARVLAPSAAANSMKIQIGPWTNIDWDAPVAAGWTTHNVIRPPAGPSSYPAEPLTVALNRGNHIVRFVAQEPGVAIDSFILKPAARPEFDGGAPGFPDPAPPLRSVRIEPGDPIVGVIASSGPRTEFVFAAGTHVIDGSGIQPLDGQSFVGEVAADGTLLSVLDGENTVTRAFRNTAEAKNVTIKQLEIKNFNSGKYDGAVDFDNTRTATDGDYETRLWVEPSYWVLEDLWIHHNAGDGVEVGSGGRLINVRSTDNRWLGIGGHGRNIEIIGGELAGNASGARVEYNDNWHSGGIKITRVKEFTMRGVHVYENYGPGIWMDISVSDALIEDNYVENNTGLSIYYEISFNGTIRNNTAIGSIMIRESADVLVENNRVRGTIRVNDEQGRRRGEIWRQPPLMRDGRPYEQRHTTIADNTVCTSPQSQSVPTGITSIGGSYIPSLDTTLWLDNDYYGGKFKIAGLDPLTAAEWQAMGNDVDGAIQNYGDCTVPSAAARNCGQYPTRPRCPDEAVYVPAP